MHALRPCVSEVWVAVAAESHAARLLADVAWRLAASQLLARRTTAACCPVLCCAVLCCAVLSGRAVQRAVQCAVPRFSNYFVHTFAAVSFRPSASMLRRRARFRSRRRSSSCCPSKSRAPTTCSVVRHSTTVPSPKMSDRNTCERQQPSEFASTVASGRVYQMRNRHASCKRERNRAFPFPKARLGFRV